MKKTSLFISKQKLINSVSTAIGLLYIIRKYLISDQDISLSCLDYIKNHTNTYNVLYVLQHLNIFCYPKGNKLDRNAQQCSSDLSYTVQFVTTVTLIIENCLKVVDKNATHILSSDTFEDVSLALVKQIISRDNLNIENECEVYKALDRWAHRQCRRKGMEPSNESKIQQLMGCQYLVRYQTMTIKEFKHCLIVSRLLTNSEVKHVTSSLMHKNYSLSRNCQLFHENVARARIGKGTLHFPQLLKRKKMERKKLSIVQNIFLLISHVLD